MLLNINQLGLIFVKCIYYLKKVFNLYNNFVKHFVTNKLTHNFEFITQNYEWATFEFETKWITLEPTPGNLQYAVPNSMIQWCQKNEIKIRGHCLFWENLMYIQNWIQALSTQDLNNTVSQHLTETMLYFGNDFMSWDVDNEMLHGNFYPSRLGNGIQPWFYSKAKAVNPNIALFTNDFNTIEGNQTTDYVLMIQSLLAAGAKIDGIGCQGHYYSPPDPNDLFSRLNQLATLNIPIQISELDVYSVDPVDRANQLEIVFRTAFSHPSVEAITMWGFWAGSHWRGPNAAIVDLNWTVNAAGMRFQSMKQEWTTNEMQSLNSTGQAYFRVFHGIHQVTVTLPSGKSYITFFEVLPGDPPRSVNIDISISNSSGRNYINWFQAIFIGISCLIAMV